MVSSAVYVLALFRGDSDRIGYTEPGNPDLVSSLFFSLLFHSLNKLWKNTNTNIIDKEKMAEFSKETKSKACYVELCYLNHCILCIVCVSRAVI